MSFLDKARTMFGPLKPEYRAKLVKYLKQPTEKGWDQIHGIVISQRFGVNTVWQAVLAVDPTFPRSADCKPRGGNRWSRIPDAILVTRAIQQATAGIEG